MKTVECVKCGEPKLESEFYKGKRNTCKECVKAVGKRRWAEKREAKKKEEWDKIREYILGNYGEANVEMNSVEVVVGGEFVGDYGKVILNGMILKHRAWMKRNHLSEPGMVPDKKRIETF